MKRTLIGTAFVCLASVAMAQTTHISSGASDDAVGSSIAIFVGATSAETVIRIAYLDGAEPDEAGTMLHIRDYDENMSLQGSRTIGIGDETSPKYTRPRLSRDGRGVVFYGSTNDDTDDDANMPFFVLLSADAYSSTGTIGATIAPYGGVDDNEVLQQSSTALPDYEQRAPAISNIDGSGHFIIVWPDLYEDAGPFNPLMYWDTGSGVTFAEDTDGWYDPAISGDGERMSYLLSDHIYFVDAAVGDWGSETSQLVSEYDDEPGNLPSMNSEIDEAGETVVFATYATNLRDNDANLMRDVYTWTPSGGPILVYDDPGQDVNATHADFPSISPDGNWVSFESDHRAFVGNLSYNPFSFVPFAFRVQVGSPGTVTPVSFNPNGSRSTPVLHGALTAIANGGGTVFHSNEQGIATGDNRSGADVIFRGD